MKLNKVLKYIVLGAVYLTPFIALLVTSSMFFPYISGKNFAFRIIIEIAVGGWLILALRDTRYRLKRSWILWALAVFVGVMALANSVGVDVSRSLGSNFERMDGYVTILHLFGLVVVMAGMLRSERLWMWLLRASVFVSVITAIKTFVEVFGEDGGARAIATLGNATYLAIYMLFHIFFSLILLYRHKGNPWLKIAYVIAIVLQLISLYLTATRGAILGLVGGLLLTALLILIFENKIGTKRSISWKTSLAGLILILVLVGGFFALRNTETVTGTRALNRLASISLEETTTKSRFMVWNIAIEGFKERPILGWGQENFNLVFNKHYNPKMFGQEPWFDRAHNIIFDWLSAGGILGLLAYLSIFVATLLSIWSRKINMSTTERALITGLLAGYFFHNLFVFDNLVSYILFGTVLGYAHFRRVESVEEPKRKFIHPRLTYVGILVVLLATLSAVYFVNIPGIQKNRTLLQALKPQEEGYARNLELFEKAIAYDSFGNQEVREQLIQSSQRIQRDPNVTPDLRQAYFEKAQDEILLQIEEQPGDARLYLFLGSMLASSGYFGDSAFYLEKALEFSPGKQIVMLELARVEMSRGNIERALEISKQAYESYPESAQLLKAYAAIAIRAGNLELAEGLLVPSFGTMLIPEDTFINAYASIGAYDIVEQLWSAVVQSSPNSAQAYISLAATRVKLGDIEGAVSAIEEGIANVSEFKDQGEQIISDIRAGRLQ